MADHIWSVLCDKTIIDQRTNKISLIDVMDRVTFLDPDGKLRQATAKDRAIAGVTFNLVSLWRQSEPNTPEEIEVRLALVGPDGKWINPPSAIHKLELKKIHIRATNEIPAIPLRGPGYYTFLVQHLPTERKRWRTVARLPFEVRFVASKDEMTP